MITAQRKTIWEVTILCLLLPCCSRQLSDYVAPGLQIDADQHLVPIGPHSLSEPGSGSYFWFVHTATGFTTVDHMEKKPDGLSERLLYLETNREQRLDRTVKADLLEVGEFGTVYAQKTCFYNRPVQSSYNSVSVRFFSNGYPSGYERPEGLPRTPMLISPPSSLSLVRILRHGTGHLLIEADYESTGELRSVQAATASGGNVTSYPLTSYPLDSNIATLQKYGIPFRWEIKKDSHGVLRQLPQPAAAEELSLFIRFYDFGKLIEEEQLRGGVAATRWLRPSVTEEERQIGPECDSRFRQQLSMGLPTAGY